MYSVSSLSAAPLGLGLPAGAARHEPPDRGAAGPARDSPALDPTHLADAIRDAALALGFARVGFCPVEPFADAGTALEGWLAAGRHGDMAFMAGEGRADPGALLPGARTLVVVALPYARGLPDEGHVGAGPASAGLDGSERRAGRELPLVGRVARYARGADYHGVMKERLRLLADRCAELAGRPVHARPCVDTAPLLEREAARRAGIGFSAKNTMSIAPGLGSYVLLGELLVDLELRPSEPIAAGCGSCRACLDACPTRAFVDAYTLDARRCISYLTIELKGAVPRELRAAIGTWVFGCDLCQEVCPFNRSSRPRPLDAGLAEKPSLDAIELVGLLELTSSGYRRLVRKRAIGRVNRVQLQRNAAIALGNTRSPSAIEPLARALAGNVSALVRGHVAWALGRIGGAEARRTLVDALALELDATVRSEIALALDEPAP
jgi:epoxyqueuosine reductase